MNSNTILAAIILLGSFVLAAIAILIDWVNDKDDQLRSRSDELR